MDISQWELDGLAQEQARRATKRRNDAFRRRMHEHRVRERARIRLKVASFAAVLAGVFAGIVWLR